METKFKVGDFIQHKDKEKRELLKLKGQIIGISEADNGKTQYYMVRYMVRYYGQFAVLVQNQDQYEKVEYQKCTICGKPILWQERHYLNPNFSVCKECYDKIPEYTRIDIAKRNYTKQVVKCLTDLGVPF